MPIKRMKKPAKARKTGRQRLKMKDWIVEGLDAGDVPGLRWRDRAAGTFEISWKHASGRTWVEKEDTEIFRLYALHTGKHREGLEADPKKWKANFRCALNSLNDVKEVTKESNKKGEKACKVYQIIDEVTVKEEKDSKDDIFTSSLHSNTSSSEDNTEEDAVVPVIKMEVPSPSSDLSQPPSPTDDTDIDHCYSKNGLANIPNLPTFKNSVCLSGGTVECRVPAVIKTFERIDIQTNNNNNTTRSQDGLNSEGEDMTDEALVQMVDSYRSDYERTDSEYSNASSTLTLTCWNDPIQFDITIGKPEPVIVVHEPLSSANPDWNLASLTELK